MTIDELQNICRDWFNMTLPPETIRNAFDEFKNTNKITPKLQWTKVYDVYLTMVGESTVLIGTFATEKGFSFQVTGRFIDALNDIPCDEYKTAEECMNVIEDRLN
jgi:hypothetical protein